MLSADFDAGATLWHTVDPSPPDFTYFLNFLNASAFYTTSGNDYNADKIMLSCNIKIGGKYVKGFFEAVVDNIGRNKASAKLKINNIGPQIFAQIRKAVPPTETFDPTKSADVARVLGELNMVKQNISTAETINLGV
jgi:hypothetical protein